MSESEALKVLVIDSNESVYHMVNILLSESLFEFQIDWCSDYKEALSQLTNGDHDVYLIEYDLTDKTGVDLIQEAERTYRSRPIIILTSSTDVNAEAESIENGASDFIRKSQLTATTLERSIRYATSRQNGYEKLKEERRKYMALFMESSAPRVLCDLEFNVYEQNESFIELMGDEALTANLELSSLLLDDSILSSFKDVIKKSKSHKNYEVQLNALHGIIDCLVTVTSIKNLDGESEGYHLIFSDLTSYKMAEKALFEEEKRSYTVKLAQMIAHEVRNPLTNINLAASQLREIESPDTEDRGIYFDIIERNSGRINELIGQLLDSSTPAVLTKDLTSCKKVIEAAIALCNDRIVLKNVTLNLELPEVERRQLLDLEKLEIALLNIMTNALEAMNNQENGALDVRLNYSETDAIITISDNGKGMLPEELSHVFEPFFTAKAGGKGLGMALTKNIISGHNGKIGISSTLNEGTTFTIELPLEEFN